MRPLRAHPQPEIAMNERRIYQIFEISIILKGLHGLIECAGGIMLIVVSTSAISRLVVLLTQGELDEDPHDFLATRLMLWAAGFSTGAKTFYAAYLLGHGLIKVVLVTALLRGMLWAYPASLVALGLFMIYQTYRFVETHGLFMLGLTIFDLLMMWLIWHEYQVIKRLRLPANAQGAATRPSAQVGPNKVARPLAPR
jgi:uncharacterized membrane protein